MKNPKDYILENLQGLTDFLDRDTFVFYCGVIEQMMTSFAKELSQEVLKSTAFNINNGWTRIKGPNENMPTEEGALYDTCSIHHFEGTLYTKVDIFMVHLLYNDGM